MGLENTRDRKDYQILQVLLNTEKNSSTTNTRLNTVNDNLEDIFDNTDISKGVGNSDVKTTRVVLDSELRNAMLIDNWTNIAGNSVAYTYDTNGNVTQIEYSSGGTLVLTKSFGYDTNNNVVQITTV